MSLEMSMQSVPESLRPVAFKAVSGDECRALSEMVGKTLKIVAYFVHDCPTQAFDGSESSYKRLCLITDDNQLIASSSKPARECCELMHSMFGQPSPEKPWTVTVRERRTKRGYRALLIVPVQGS